ncbi:MAG TPA: DUF3800 domain-containing protein [Longimicrobiaceae bacterium]|nr:DUF3800 domain-containing protein [Longimicrobiaceae bacterium]
MKYRVYIDETGNSDMKSSGNPNHRYLSLTGVVLDLTHTAAVVHPQMEALKSSFFEAHHPDEPVIFHRKEIVNRKHPFECLEDEQVRGAFDAAVLECFRRWEYTLISVCLDKQRYLEKYRQWRYDPYHYCLSVLLEHFVPFLEDEGAQADAMAESRGKNEDMRLKEEFTRIWMQGTENVSAERFQAVLSSRQLKVKPKAANVAGLQLADLVAHPCRNIILQENGLLEKEIAPFGTVVAEALEAKHLRRADLVVGKEMR